MKKIIAAIIVSILATPALAANPLPQTTEKLDQKIPVIIDQMEEFSKKGIEFIEQQAPQVCQELIQLGKVQWTTVNAAFFLFFWVGVGVWIQARQEGKKYSWGNNSENSFSEFCCVVRGILALILMIGSPIVVGCYIRQAFVVWFAPRVYLIEYFAQFAGLMKK